MQRYAWSRCECFQRDELMAQRMLGGLLNVRAGAEGAGAGGGGGGGQQYRPAQSARLTEA